MATVREIYQYLDSKAPFSIQMDFDNAGFLVGRGGRTVTRLLAALDITEEGALQSLQRSVLMQMMSIYGNLAANAQITGNIMALISR